MRGKPEAKSSLEQAEAWGRYQEEKIHKMEHSLKDKLQIAGMYCVGNPVEENVGRFCGIAECLRAIMDIEYGGIEAGTQAEKKIKRSLPRLSPNGRNSL